MAAEIGTGDNLYVTDGLHKGRSVAETAVLTSSSPPSTDRVIKDIQIELCSLVGKTLEGQIKNGKRHYSRCGWFYASA
jgi:hypothetical protein